MRKFYIFPFEYSKLTEKFSLFVKRLKMWILKPRTC